MLESNEYSPTRILPPLAPILKGSTHASTLQYMEPTQATITTTPRSPTNRDVFRLLLLTSSSPSPPAAAPQNHSTPPSPPPPRAPSTTRKPPSPCSPPSQS